MCYLTGGFVNNKCSHVGECYEDLVGVLCACLGLEVQGRASEVERKSQLIFCRATTIIRATVASSQPKMSKSGVNPSTLRDT